jgi:hypothetical protein
MRTLGHRRSIRTWVTLTATSAAAASGLAVLGNATAFAQTPPPDSVLFAPGTTHTAEEGPNNVDGWQVAQFVDTGALATCTPTDYSADVNWGDNTDHSAGTITCAVQAVTGEADVALYTVTGSHTYKDSGAFSIRVTVTEPDATRTSNSADPDKATISDADISATSPTNLRGGGQGGTVEGATAGASAFFFDSNTTFADAGTVDPGLTATVNWGDGSTSPAPTIVWPDCGECGGANVLVAALHIYDANIPVTKPYSVTITLHDDGGKSATSQAADTPAFTDGALTADASKSLTATTTKAFTAAVGSFKDAAGAQAKAADFAATINWGDSVSSSGTVSQISSGAFSVSGTHTYASAGTKSITATVTDEEGQTVTLHATATVGAAPVVLPATGQPHQAPSPVMPALPMALLLVGVAAIAAGLHRARAPRP